MLNNVNDVLNNTNLLLNNAVIEQVRHYMQALYVCVIDSQRRTYTEGCCRVKPIRFVDLEWSVFVEEEIVFYDAQERRLLWGDDGRQRPDGSFYNGGDV